MLKKDNGIDKIKDVDEVAAKFSNCINIAHNIIPTERKHRTKINLGKLNSIVYDKKSN